VNRRLRLDRKVRPADLVPMRPRQVAALHRQVAEAEDSAAAAAVAVVAVAGVAAVAADSVVAVVDSEAADLAAVPRKFR
jgi:hypothetical protein